MLVTSSNFVGFAKHSIDGGERRDADGREDCSVIGKE